MTRSRPGPAPGSIRAASALVSLLTHTVEHATIEPLLPTSCSPRSPRDTCAGDVTDGAKLSTHAQTERSRRLAAAGSGSFHRRAETARGVPRGHATANP